MERGFSLMEPGLHLWTGNQQSVSQIAALLGGDRKPLRVWRSAFGARHFPIPANRGDVGVPGVLGRTQSGTLIMGIRRWHAVTEENAYARVARDSSNIALAIP
jgi:hypothetical protein